MIEDFFKNKFTIEIMTSKSASLANYLYELYGSSEEARNSILFQVHNGNQAHIIFNRPQKFNSFSMGMYHVFSDYIDKANQMQEIKYIVIKGAGDNFSSGNDLGNFMLPEIMAIENRSGLAKVMAGQLDVLSEKLVKSEKPIFCIVQGKVVGFAFTQLAIYDRVFAVEGATFMAPLVKLAQGPEMASSYLFPKIFGQALGEDIIIKGKVMNVPELEKYGLVKSCPNIDDANRQLQEYIKELDELDWPSYVNARRLMRQGLVDGMLKALRVQSINLVERWCNPDLAAYLMNYMAKRKENKGGKPRL